MTSIRIYCDWHKRPKVVGELRWFDQIGRWLPARVTSAKGWRAKAEWLEQLEEMLNHPEEHGYTREAIETAIGELEEEFSQQGIDPRSVTGPASRHGLWIAEGGENPVPELMGVDRRGIVWESRFVYGLTCWSCKAKGKRVEYFKADSGLLGAVLDALRNQQVEEVEVHTLKRFYDKHANQVKRKLGTYGHLGYD